MVVDLNKEEMLEAESIWREYRDEIMAADSIDIGSDRFAVKIDNEEITIPVRYPKVRDLLEKVKTDETYEFKQSISNEEWGDWEDFAENFVAKRLKNSSDEDRELINDLLNKTHTRFAEIFNTQEAFSIQENENGVYQICVYGNPLPRVPKITDIEIARFLLYNIYHEQFYSSQMHADS